MLFIKQNVCNCGYGIAMNQKTVINPKVAKELKGLEIKISGRGSISIHPPMSEIQEFINKKRRKLRMKV